MNIRKIMFDRQIKVAVKSLKNIRCRFLVEK